MTATARRRASTAGNVKLLTRKGLDWTARFAAVASAAKALDLSSALIDGEIVVEDGNGIPSFNLLQADLSAGRQDRLRYHAFDILYCEGFDLRQATLRERKAPARAGAGPPAGRRPDLLLRPCRR